MNAWLLDFASGFQLSCKFSSCSFLFRSLFPRRHLNLLHIDPVLILKSSGSLPKLSMKADQLARTMYVVKHLYQLRSKTWSFYERRGQPIFGHFRSYNEWTISPDQREERQLGGNPRFSRTDTSPFWPCIFYLSRPKAQWKRKQSRVRFGEDAFRKKLIWACWT